MIMASPLGLTLALQPPEPDVMRRPPPVPARWTVIVVMGVPLLLVLEIEKRIRTWWKGSRPALAS